MILGSMLLAVTLGQVNPPPARHDPPPCVVARVPGCREGYRLRYDAYGHPFYFYDPSTLSDSPPPAAAAQPPPYVAPPPVVSPPAYPPPSYIPPTPVYAPAPANDSPTEPGLQLGLIWAPAGVTSVSDWGSWEHTWRDEDRYAGFLAVALRGPISGAQLRLSFEFGPLVRVGELSFKYNFNASGMLQPFLSAGIGAARLDGDLGVDPGTRAELSVSGGLDLFVTQNFFLTTELKARGFTNKHDAAVNSDLGQVAFFFGAGMFL